MAQISAALVKELRERTGAGIGDCKKALEATEGDLNAAAEKLRMDGAAKADKKAGRTAAEGVLAIVSGDDAVAVVELNSETDFVAKGEDFRGLAKAAAELALAQRPATVEELVALEIDGESLDAKRRALIGKIGENMTIRRFEIVTSAGGPLVTYMHPGDKTGVIVAMAAGEEALAKDLAMHIAAMSPKYLDKDAIPADMMDAERRVIEAQVAEQAEGKPAEIVAKMVDGKLRKFAAEITLLGQPFVRNDAYGMKSDDAIEKVLEKTGAKVAGFVRFAVGEGIEKKKEDFAAEVMAQAGIKS